MFEWFKPLFKNNPKEDENCDCGCGTPVKFLPYDKGGAHETKLAASTLQNPVSPEAKAFYDKMKPSVAGDHVMQSRGGCGGGCSN